MISSRIFGQFGLLCVAASLLGCAQKDVTKAAGPAPAVPVVVAKVLQKDVPLAVRSIGNVQAFQSVAIKSMISAQLIDVHFKQGQDVNQGDLLFQLDPRQ